MKGEIKKERQRRRGMGYEEEKRKDMRKKMKEAKGQR